MDYLADLIVAVRKVRVASGDGDTVNKAIDCVSRLSASELVRIPGIEDAPESWRRVATQHREMSRLTGGNVYFLSCRDAAKASPGLTHQTANNINLVLVNQEGIEIVRAGDQRPNGKATRFRYLLD